MTTAPAHDPRTLLFIGDSITACGRAEDPDDLGFGYVRLLAEHFAAHEPSARVVNTGIGGETAADVAERFGPDALDRDPQVVTVYVGVNDVWHGATGGERVSDEDFARTYRYLLDQLSATRPGIPVLLVTPFVVDVDENISQLHEELDAKVAIIRDLAKEFGSALVDLEPVLDEAWRVGHTPATIAADGVHPTIAGHRLIADAWLEAFAPLDHIKGRRS